MASGSYADDLWAIVLAGGSGCRLQSFLRDRGCRYPIKQFCAITGRRTMLEHTWQRVELLVAAEHMLTVVDAAHAHILNEQLDGERRGDIIYQPANRETAPGVLLPLAHIVQRDPTALVAIFPSDHFVLEAERFMAHVQIAACAVRRGWWDIALLTVVPDRYEGDYGWVEVARSGRHAESCLLPITRFWEKPDPHTGRALYEAGHLWSTMVTVARAAALWELVYAAQPALRAPFEQIRDAVGTPAEAAAVERAYRDLPSVSLSGGVFARMPRRLAAIAVRGVLWSDWGREERVAETLRRLNRHGAHHQTEVTEQSAVPSTHTTTGAGCVRAEGEGEQA